jgi:hypothetical protein
MDSRLRGNDKEWDCGNNPAKRGAGMAHGRCKLKIHLTTKAQSKRLEEQKNEYLLCVLVPSWLKIPVKSPFEPGTASADEKREILRALVTRSE